MTGVRGGAQIGDLSRQLSRSGASARRRSFPVEDLWQRQLVSSRLLEYELRTRAGSIDLMAMPCER